MRQRLLETLPPTRYRRFLVYVMGPYKRHDGPDEDAFGYLERVRDDLREAGFNAFLATDVEIPVEAVDAGTQTIGFARASNAVVFVYTHVGKNLGVGIETGAVLEDMTDHARERVLVCHEAGMRSAMLGAVGDRWDAAVREFEDREDLVDQVRLFAADVMNREATGDLDVPPAGD